jgi:hypothetical protein
MARNRLIAILLSTLVVLSGVSSVATAAVVSTRDALAMDQPGQRLSAVQAGLARADVQEAMIALGVDPLEAQARVAALDAQQLASLQSQLDQLPAGGILGLIGAVFVVLLILELTGVIDIFKKV